MNICLTVATLTKSVLLDLPLAFFTEPPWPSGRKQPSLCYRFDPYRPPETTASTQPVLRNRLIGTPLIDLNNYNCKAEIDWVEIWLSTPRRHQARNMQRAIAKMLESRKSQSTVFVSGPNRERGYLGQNFILKFQQPKPRELQTVLEEVLIKYAPDWTLEDLRLTGIEVSVDFYVKNPAALDTEEIHLRRWQMVDVLRRHLRPEPVLTETVRCWPRFFGDPYGGNGATFFLNPSETDLSASLVPKAAALDLHLKTFIPLDLKKHTQPLVDRTGYIGTKGGVVELKTMDKVTDQRNPEAGTYRALPLHERRARTEVTLQGAPDEIGGQGAIGMKSVADLYGFNFQKEIRKLVFEFFLPTFGETCETRTLGFPVKVSEQEVFRRSGVYGLDRLHRSIHDINLKRYQRGSITQKPVKLRKKGRLVSWKEMNRKVDRALSKLGKDWNI